MNSNLENFFSEKEIQMITEIGCLEFAETLVIELAGAGKVFLYKHMAQKCFLEDKKGPAVDSLRRCYNAILKMKVTSGLDEFIKL